MARYIKDTSGETKQVSGTNYIPPCLAKTASRKAEPFFPAPSVETAPEQDEAAHKDTD